MTPSGGGATAAPSKPAAGISFGLPARVKVWNAAKSGDQACLQKCLSKASAEDLNFSMIDDSCGDRSFSALGIAAHGGHTAIVTMLIKAGANTNLRESENGCTALMEAARQGCTATVQTLIMEGADINIADKHGWTALMLASREGHTGTVRVLIQAGAVMEMRNEDSETALLIAYQHGVSAAVHELRQARAGLNLQDRSTRRKMLWIAAKAGDNRLLQECLVGASAADFDFEKCDTSGWTFTVLGIAAKEGHTDIIIALIKAGAGVNHRTKEAGDTALMAAAENGHASAVQALIGSGADINLQDMDGYTALMVASKGGHSIVVQALIAAGADFNSQDSNGRTALWYASAFGHPSTVLALLEAGADRNIRDNRQLTAADKAPTAVLKKLLETY
jgi:ankyrin repeat protein